jgi:hypothetical protein
MIGGVAHAGHMRLENPRGDSWNRGPDRAPETRAKSQDRGDSCTLLKNRECRAASLPRRRSPVRTRCSAPTRPDSAHFADPGLFMAVAFHGDAARSQRFAERCLFEARRPFGESFRSLPSQSGTRMEHLRAWRQAAVSWRMLARRTATAFDDASTAAALRAMRSSSFGEARAAAGTLV